MSTFLQSLIDPKKNFLARMHMKAVSTRLRRYGQNLNRKPFDLIESGFVDFLILIPVALFLPLCVFLIGMIQVSGTMIYTISMKIWTLRKL